MIDATIYKIYKNNRTILFKHNTDFTYKSRKIQK